MSTSSILTFLAQKKWVILIPTVCSILLAWALSRQIAPEYTSVAELSTGYMDASLQPSGARSTNNTVLFNNVIQTMQSNQVLDLICYNILINRLDKIDSLKADKKEQLSNQVAKYPGGKKGLISAINSKLSAFQSLDLSKSEDKIIYEIASTQGCAPNQLLNSIEIKRIEGSDFITISSTTNDATLSALISNQLCKGFLALYQNNQGKAVTTSLDTLKSIVDDKKQILDNKLQLLNTSDGLPITSSLGMIEMLQQQMAQQKANLIAAQVALDNTTKQLQTTNVDAGLSNNQVIISLRAKIDNLWEKYVDEGSRDQGLLNQINTLRSSLQERLTELNGNTSGETVATLQKQKINQEVQVKAASQTLADIQAKLNQATAQVSSANSQQGLVQGIQNDIDVARTDYINANTAYTEAKNRNIFPGNTFNQVLIASPALKPNPSKRSSIIGFSGAGIFCLVIFTLLFIEFINPSIKTSSFLKENTQLPILTSVTDLKLNHQDIKSIFSLNTKLPRLEKLYSDEIKQLRFAIQNSPAQIILACSSHPVSGKSSLLLSLAYSLVLNKKRTLIVDANFQNNTISTLYNATPTLESFTYNPDNPTDAITSAKKAIPQFEDGAVSIVACKPSEHTPNEILPKDNILQLLNSNLLDYDYILIDCPALNLGPTCKELLKYAKATLLVFSADQVYTNQDRDFIRFLKQSDITILGCVLNKVKPYNLVSDQT